jgi:putative protease
MHPAPKILSPATRADEIPELIRAGADEFYGGVLDRDWMKAYPAASIDRRQERAAHFSSFDELGEVMPLLLESHMPFFLTINEHYFIPSQYHILLGQVERGLEMGIDRFIVSDPAFMIELREHFPEARICVSVGGCVLNSEAMRFFADMGADRVILPRQLTLHEIESLAHAVPGMETEVFVLNSRCANLDGYCRFHHGLQEVSEGAIFPNACMLDCQVTASSSTLSSNDFEKALQEKLDPRRQVIWSLVHIDSRPCGVCAMWDLREMAVTSVKIAGRGNPGWKKRMDVEFLAGLRKELDSSTTRQDFIQMARMVYRQTYGQPCREAMCYYPDVLEKNEL